MAQKIYVVLIKDTNELCTQYECYKSHEKAKEFIYKSVSAFPESRKILKTRSKNEFIITDLDCNYIHTLKICDIWLK